MAEIASDKDYLDSKMDSIISTASDGSTGITIDSASYTSTSRIPSAEPEIENTLLTHIGILFQKIVKEAQSIKSVGVDFQDMDNFLEGVSTNLGFEVMSKDTPIVDLIDYSNMSFEDLLNANIPSVPSNYKNTGSSPLDKYYGNSGGGSPVSTPTGSSGSSPSKKSSTTSSTPSKGSTTTSKPDYTLPDYSTTTSGKKIDTSKDSSTSKVSDYNPLEGFENKKNTTTDKDYINTPSTNGNNSGDGVVKLSSTNRGGTSARHPYVNNNPYNNTESDDIIDVDDMEVLDEELNNDVIPEDYMESFVDNDIPTVIEENEVVIPKTHGKEDRTLRTLGIAAGIGLAAGAAALGAHELMKSKEDYEDEDYGYESAGDN